MAKKWGRHKKDKEKRNGDSDTASVVSAASTGTNRTAKSSATATHKERQTPKAGKHHHNHRVRLPKALKHRRKSNDDDADADSVIIDQHSQSTTVALVHAVMPIVVPAMHRAICKHLLQEGVVTRNGEPVWGFDERNQPSQDDMPLRPIEVNVEKLKAVSVRTIIRDRESSPSFQWPERGWETELMRMIPGVGVKMVVFDLIGLNADVRFGDGVELAFPVEGADGVKATIEVGSNHRKDGAWVKVFVPRLRVWFLNDQPRKLFTAFMEQPRVDSNLRATVDRGNGIFDDSIGYDDDGSLNNELSRLLYNSFGLGSHTADIEEQVGSRLMGSRNSISVADAIGKKIAEAVGDTSETESGGRPLEVFLEEEGKEEVMDILSRLALHKPRAEPEIRNDMNLLKKELALAIARDGPCVGYEDDDSFNRDGSQAQQEGSREQGGSESKFGSFLTSCLDIDLDGLCNRQ